MPVFTTVLGYAALAVVSTGVVWKGSVWLESSSEQLSSYYELPPLVQGAVVLAIGSSFPELATAVLATYLHANFELGVAAIVGSALFNVLMIPALSGLWSKEKLISTRDLVYKEVQFYLISICALLLTFAFAVIYSPAGPAGGPVEGTLTRGLVLFPLALYGFYVYLQYQDTKDYQTGTVPKDLAVGRQFALLGASLLVILIGVEGLVRAAIGFGDVLGTPSFLWGITVVAAGTSIPDAFVSVRAARSGNAVASVANVVGSNVFDLLVCIPAGVLVGGAVLVNFSVAAPMIGVLVIATMVVFVMMRSQMHLTTNEAWGLIVIYVAFVVWMSVETFGAVDFLPNVPPPMPSEAP